MKKSLLIFVTFVLAFALTACANDSTDPANETPDFSVEATASSADAGLTADDLLKQTMDASGITYTDDNGYIDNVGGFGNGTNEYWHLYYNEELASAKASDIILDEGDTVALRWESDKADDNGNDDTEKNADKDNDKTGNDNDIDEITDNGSDDDPEAVAN